MNWDKKIIVCGNATMDEIIGVPGKQYDFGAVTGYMKLLGEFVPPGLLVPVVNVGSDKYGNEVMKEYKKLGLDMSRVRQIKRAKSRVNRITRLPNQKLEFERISEGKRLQQCYPATISLENAGMMVAQAVSILFGPDNYRYCHKINEVLVEANRKDVTTYWDINLRRKSRKQLYGNEIFLSQLDPVMSNMNIVQGNDGEIYALSRRFQVGEDVFARDFPEKRLEKIAFDLCNSYSNIQKVIVTRSRFGSMIITQDGQKISVGPLKLTDTPKSLGCGDRHLNGIMLGPVYGLTNKEALLTGSTFAAYITTKEFGYPDLTKEKFFDIVKSHKDYYTSHGLNVDEFLSKFD
jgi:sugar/nucleoside kinase (ribokinase family)